MIIPPRSKGCVSLAKTPTASIYLRTDAIQPQEKWKQKTRLKLNRNPHPQFRSSCDHHLHVGRSLLFFHLFTCSVASTHAQLATAPTSSPPRNGRVIHCSTLMTPGFRKITKVVVRPFLHQYSLHAKPGPKMSDGLSISHVILRLTVFISCDPENGSSVHQNTRRPTEGTFLPTK